MGLMFTFTINCFHLLLTTIFIYSYQKLLFTSVPCWDIICVIALVPCSITRISNSAEAFESLLADLHLFLLAASGSTV